MKTIINYDDNYSISYREQLSNAIVESGKLGFNRPLFISEKRRISDESLRIASKLVNDLTLFLDTILPGYWGNSCQTLSSNIFAHLNSRGLPADIILGNVIINGTDEFESTLETLQQEVLATKPLTGHQAVHAWVSLGDDTIIDAALPPRLAKYYGAPPQFNDTILIDRASEMSARFNLRYQPILAGTEFFAKTNPPDPMELLNSIK